MNPITSIYIPHIEARFNAEFIASIFERNGIAQVSRIYIEPCTIIMKNEANKNKNNYDYNYNNAYIEILCWYDTETAYNFIECLRNPCKEARIICGHNNWWTAHINNYPEKLYNKTRVLTIFRDSNIDEDELSTTAVADPYMYYKNKSKKINSIDIDNKYEDDLKAKIYGYKNAAEMNAAEAFDGYLHEKPKLTRINNIFNKR
jgi:hypothetical protein